MGIPRISESKYITQEFSVSSSNRLKKLEDLATLTRDEVEKNWHDIHKTLGKMGLIDQFCDIVFRSGAKNVAVKAYATVIMSNLAEKHDIKPPAAFNDKVRLARNTLILLMTQGGWARMRIKSTSEKLYLEPGELNDGSEEASPLSRISCLSRFGSFSHVSSTAVLSPIGNSQSVACPNIGADCQAAFRLVAMRDSLELVAGSSLNEKDSDSLLSRVRDSLQDDPNRVGSLRSLDRFIKKLQPGQVEKLGFASDRLTASHLMHSYA